ncbi:hypothetical protein [Pseudonocardia sp. N23]|uniref:phage terminase small subunit n=1 Tax=Pseudonocardia sp. N23 TaxID=1987376 RepID=UPI000BFB7933|nr:hypothetical protein [Pseudonocardia sp. N23]GAY12046.1 hypothetical protein TOK_0436 [Pseudonocardia sp. N23]
MATIPKPAEQRQRRNKRVVDTPPAAPESARRVPEWRRASSKWHPAARDWYLSLRESGQAFYYQPSDRMAAWFLAEQMSRVLADPEAKASSYDSVMRGMEQLLCTERSRRQAHVELAPPGASGRPPAGGASTSAGEQRAAEVEAGIAHLDDARRRLSGS